MQDEANGKRNLLSIGEASEYLGVSIDTLRRWEKRGRIEPYRSPGGHRHYSKIELDKLFDKKYVRDEPTVRSPSVYNDKTTEIPESISQNLQNNLETQNTFSGYNEAPKPLTPSVINSGPTNSIPVETFETHPPLQQTYQPSEPTPPVNKEYSLPPWRTPVKVEETKEVVKTNSDETYIREEIKTFEVDNQSPVRIPQTQPIRVIENTGLITPEEAYFRQQSVSILNPQTSNQTVTIPRPPESQLQQSFQNQQQNNNVAKESDNKNLIIYISAGIGILILIITWYLLWRSSQSVLSPIP